MKEICENRLKQGRRFTSYGNSEQEQKENNVDQSSKIVKFGFPQERNKNWEIMQKTLGSSPATIIENCRQQREKPSASKKQQEAQSKQQVFPGREAKENKRLQQVSNEIKVGIYVSRNGPGQTKRRANQNWNQEEI